MTPLPYLQLHQVRGADAAPFLQAQLAADIASLAVGESGFAAWCSARGQVIAVFLVYREMDGWLLACEARLADTVFGRLRRYVLRAQVMFVALDALLLAGLEEHEQPAGATLITVPRHTGLRYGAFDRSALPKTSSGELQGLERWRAMEMKRGITWLEPATSERFIPQMLGLEQIDAVSFAKGCYPGQEIVARTRFLGKLKRKPVLVEIDGSIAGVAGDPCSVRGEDETHQPFEVEAALLEAVAIEATGADARAKRTLALLVAPIEETSSVASIELAGNAWPARRIKTGFIHHSAN